MFSLRSMLKRLRSTVTPAAPISNGFTIGLKIVQKRRLHLIRALRWVAGSLIGSSGIETVTGEAVVRTNPELRALCESVNNLDIEQRRSLGQNQLAKAMHAMLASHVTWMPTGLGTLMARVGAEYTRLRDFKAALEVVLENFKARVGSRLLNWPAYGARNDRQGAPTNPGSSCAT